MLVIVLSVICIWIYVIFRVIFIIFILYMGELCIERWIKWFEVMFFGGFFFVGGKVRIRGL